MKNKILVSGATLVVMATIGMATVGSVSAASNNGQTRQGDNQRQSLEVKAKALGVGIDELRGNNWKDIAKQKGVDEQKVYTALRESAQERWKSRGLSEDAIKDRLADMEKRQSDCDGEGNGHNGGYGQGLHRR